MKRLLSIIVSVCLIIALVPQSALAGSNSTFRTTITGSFGNSYTVDNIYFEPDTLFHADNSNPDLDLAIASLTISLKNNGKWTISNFLKTIGFDKNSIKSFDFNRTGQEEYMTGYTYATKEITRDGKSCTLVLVAVNSFSQDDGDESTSGWNSIIPDFDFLNYEMDKKNFVATDFSSTKALTFTKAAEQILEGSSNVPEGESVLSLVSALNDITVESPTEDYLVWVVGQSRGGAIGNYLSKLLIDNYGTEHVVSYLFSVPNVDKDALDCSSELKDKYKTIFNIVNPEDVVTYIPFGKEGGENWGYARWGVDLYLDCLTTAGSAVIEKQSEIYSSFTENITKNTRFYSDGVYYGYDQNNGNGIAVKELIASFAAAIPSPAEYYQGKVSYSTETESQNDGINILSYLIDVKEQKEDLMSAFMKIKSAATQQCDLNCLITFSMKHLLGYSDFFSLISGLILPNISNIDNIRVVAKEAYIAHTPENYLSWLIAEKEVNGSFPYSAFSADSALSKNLGVISTAKAVISKTSKGKRAIRLTWTTLSGADVDCFQIYRSTKSGSGYKKIYTTKSGNTKSYKDSSGLKSGTKYYYKIRGVKTVDGEKTYSAWSKKIVKTF